MSTAILPPVPAPATTPPLAAPPLRARPSGYLPHRWTIDEYRELSRTGLFRDVKTMLLHGELYVMAMPNPPHDFALDAADEFLRTVCPPGHYIRNQQGFDVGTDNDPGPDLAVVPGSRRDYAARTPTTAILVIEIANDSLFKDMTTKAELYATAGVPEYWVVDVEHRQLVIFRDPKPLSTGLGATAYKSHVTLAPTDSAATLFAPAVPVLVSDLLPR